MSITNVIPISIIIIPNGNAIIILKVYKQLIELLVNIKPIGSNINNVHINNKIY